MAALPDLITVAQYRLLPDDGGAVYELHHGEVVTVSRPKAWHWEMQEHLVGLLKPRLPRFRVGMEFAFRAIPEFDLRAADVAAVGSDRYAVCDPNDNLHGAPELAIEVKSPSNTKREMQDMASLCLANGCIQFWILDRNTKSVTVIQRDGSRQTFGIGETLSLAAFGGESLSVAEIFE
ncbi:MAG: Uma2 family endonuclease [Bryobacteraceae bacterium]